MVYAYSPQGPLDLVQIPSPTKFSLDVEKRDKEIQLYARDREMTEKSNDQAKYYAKEHKKKAHF